MNYISVRICTDVEAHKNEIWPDFGELSRPRMGETVEARSGARLRVVNVLHRQESHPDGYTHVVEIELGK